MPFGRKDCNIAPDRTPDDVSPPRDKRSPATFHTVAIGVAGEPTAPGRRSGGAVSRKRERL
jgi:hypothetical protein